MAIRTKLNVPPERVTDLISRALERRVVSLRELTEGSYATLWLARLSDGRDVVLKLAPPSKVELLSYEREIIRTEALFYELAAQTGVPVPALLHADLDGPIQYLIMSAIDGVPWFGADERLAADDRRRLRRELGRQVAVLHQITGTTYGYPQQPAMTATSWTAAFLAMIDGVLADAVRFRADLPLPAARIANAVRAHAHVLQDVRVPVLVHFDLWPGNVLLDLTGERPTIAGLIDHERAFWGDPVADFVSLDVFGASERDEDLVGGYREAGGRLPRTASVRVRLALYRLYLYLIMLVEEGPRGFSATSIKERHDLTVRALLDQMRILNAPR
ncbi:MAG TPA: aminoglycoside phosphotransferase family protein [Streptosporangiaceae bacterium]|nr:aminoglycoside phosphotransferase family protein [Streptosporangiaceae bacterium]